MAGTPRIVRIADIPPTPWPNGKGVTRDLARTTGPDGRLDWLVTIADLTEDAPFSHISGVDRVFTPIEGGEVELTIDGHPALCRLLVPTHFPGDRPTAMRMLGGPARAFNLMVDRATWHARVSVQKLAAGHGMGVFDGAAAVFCLEGRIEAGASLAAGEALIGAAPCTVTAQGGPALVIVAEIARRMPSRR